VEAGGPADKAGVEAGDIITRVDGKPIDKSGDLPRIVGATKPGAKTTLQVFRRGGLSRHRGHGGGVRARASATRRAGGEAQPAVPKSAIGLAVSDLSEAQKRELKLRGGVRVESAEGAAARAGLREGDIIVTLDNSEVTDAKQFNSRRKADKVTPDQRDGAARRVDQLSGDSPDVTLTLGTKPDRRPVGQVFPSDEISALSSNGRECELMFTSVFVQGLLGVAMRIIRGGTTAFSDGERTE